MDEKQIISLIDKIENELTDKEAMLVFKAFGEVAVCGSEQAYLRMGIEFLKCAFPKHYSPYSGKINFNKIIREDSDYFVDHVTYSEKELKAISS